MYITARRLLIASFAAVAMTAAPNVQGRDRSGAYPCDDMDDRALPAAVQKQKPGKKSKPVVILRDPGGSYPLTEIRQPQKAEDKRYAALTLQPTVHKP